MAFAVVVGRVMHCFEIEGDREAGLERQHLGCMRLGRALVAVLCVRGREERVVESATPAPGNRSAINSPNSV